MRLRLISAALLASAVLPAHALAATAILSWTGATQSNHLSYVSTQTIGWTFRPEVDLQVTALGLFDLAHDGFDQAHPIGLWDANGALLTTTTLSAGAGAALLGDFRYNPISAITLAAGTTYTIGVLMTQPSSDLYYFAPSTVLADSRVGYIGGVRTDEDASGAPGALTMPVSNNNNGRFGPNFQFTAASVPEPGQWALLILGFGAVGAAARRRATPSCREAVA